MHYVIASCYNLKSLLQVSEPASQKVSKHQNASAGLFIVVFVFSIYLLFSIIIDSYLFFVSIKLLFSAVSDQFVTRKGDQAPLVKQSKEGHHLSVMIENLCSIEYMFNSGTI